MNSNYSIESSKEILVENCNLNSRVKELEKENQDLKKMLKHCFFCKHKYCGHCRYDGINIDFDEMEICYKWELDN